MLIAEQMPDASIQPLLEVADLKVAFSTSRGRVQAVDGVSFQLRPGEILGVVGESGCGKSVMARAILGLVLSPPALVSANAMTYHGRGGAPLSLIGLERKRFRRVRGKEISMIFQEPMTSLNPVFTIGDQLTEHVITHERVSAGEAKKRALRLLEAVGIPSPELRISEYPHQFSGGMRQRVMIAMAMACNPRILIADEPTTALDVTIQAQILRLLALLRDQQHTSIIFISHDLAVVSSLADRVIVMYLGKIVEEGAPGEIFRRPLHPYTQALMDSLPTMTSDREHALQPIAGSLPDSANLPSGCRFHPRCPYATGKCHEHAPELAVAARGGQVACWLHE